MSRWFSAVALILLLANLGRSENNHPQASTPADVIVRKISGELSKVDSSFINRFPDDKPIPKFSGLNTLDWREQKIEFSKALVAKAREQNLEDQALESALKIIFDRETLAVVPVAAFRASLAGRAVWIIYLNWEIRSTKLALTKQGPKVDERSIYGLGHIRVYAMTVDTLEPIAFQTCM